MGTEPLDHPPHYPYDGTYADLLCWHMDYWGTRPDGSTKFNGLPWETTEFRCAAFPRSWEEESNRVGLGNWRGAGYRPLENVASAIKRALFNAKPIFRNWSDDLDAAWKRSKGKGKNKRTKVFPEPPPPPHTFDRASVPRETPYFIGRDQDVEAIVTTIAASSNGCAILVQGGPGMGKTELTKAIANHPAIESRFGNRRWFVPLEAATTDGDLKDSVVGSIGCARLDGFDAALQLLSVGPALLILDNLETPWEPVESRALIEQTLSQLSSIPNLTLLASIRGRDLVGGVRWKSRPELCELSPALATQLFAEISGEWVRKDPHLNSIIDALGGIPLAIRLVAGISVAQSNLSGLWQEWRRIGVELATHPDLKISTQSSLRHSFEISINSLAQSALALRILDLIGHCPVGLAEENIEIIVGVSAFQSIARLSRAGLIYMRDGRANVLAPIRDYITRFRVHSAEHEVSIASHFVEMSNDLWDSYKYYKDNKCIAKFYEEYDNIEKYMPVYLTNAAREKASTAIKKFVLFKIESGKYRECFSEFSEVLESVEDWYGVAECEIARGDLLRSFCCRNDEARQAYDSALMHYRRVKANPSLIASSTFLVGRSLLELRQHEKSMKYFENSRKQYESIENEFGIAECIYGIALNEFCRNNLAEALELFEKGQVLFGKYIFDYTNERYAQSFDSPHFYAASCKFYLGCLALLSKDFDLAEKMLKDAYQRYDNLDDYASIYKADAIQELLKSNRDVPHSEIVQIIAFYDNDRRRLNLKCILDDLENTGGAAAVISYLFEHCSGDNL